MPAAGQRLEDILDPRRVARGDDVARAGGGQRVARPVAHPPARALDHRHQRGEIVELQAGLDDDVEMARARAQA